MLPATLQRQHLRSPGGWRPPQCCTPEPTVRRAPGAPRCVLGAAIRNRGLAEVPQPRPVAPQGTGLLPHTGWRAGWTRHLVTWCLAVGGGVRALNGQLSGHRVHRGYQPATAPMSEDTPALSGVPEGQLGLRPPSWTHTNRRHWRPFSVTAVRPSPAPLGPTRLEPAQGCGSVSRGVGGSHTHPQTPSVPANAPAAAPHP